MNNVNFIKTIPPHKQEQIKRWFLTSVTTIIIIVLMLLSYTAYRMYQLFVHAMHLNQLKQQIAHQSRLEQNLITTRQRHEEIKKEHVYINKQITKSLNIFQILDELARLIPDTIALDRFTMQKKELHLEGTARDYRALIQFVEHLEQAQTMHKAQLISLRSQQQEDMLFTIKSFARK